MRVISSARCRIFWRWAASSGVISTCIREELGGPSAARSEPDDGREGGAAGIFAEERGDAGAAAICADGRGVGAAAGIGGDDVGPTGTPAGTVPGSGGGGAPESRPRVASAIADAMSV